MVKRFWLVRAIHDSEPSQGIVIVQGLPVWAIIKYVFLRAGTQKHPAITRSTHW
jgi:hypothetical protein